MRKILKLFLLVGAAFALYFYYTLFASYSSRAVFVVNIGDSIVNVADNLESQGFIKSKNVFKFVFVLLNGKDKNVAYGEYVFSDKDYNMYDIISKIGRGKADRAGIPITIPEGFSLVKISERVERVYGIDAAEFAAYAKDYVGKLFPETYFFSNDVKKEVIVKRMVDEFDKRVGVISDRDLVLASIIEGEAKSAEDMKIVAGILNKRIKLGMALQVDVAPETYKTNEVPARPINNPGLNAVEAVRNPIITDYLYYITGDDGNMYYSKTFEQHKINIKKYLK